MTALQACALPRLQFLDNIDPHTFQALFQKINPQKTGVIAISKSGNTPEPLMQLLTCLAHWESQSLIYPLKEHFCIIAQPGANGIREIAALHNLPCFEHPSDIGGRYAAFTIVGLLPALLGGLKAQAFRDGAQAVLKDFEKPAADLPAPLLGAVLGEGLRRQGFSQSVFMPYVDRLRPLADWYRQLWAESLGKDGQGTTPVQALGAVDQHSQLQLYLDGPVDKMFTILALDGFSASEDTLPLEASQIPSHPALEPFRGKTMGDLMKAEQRATWETLRRHGRPTRVMTFPRLDEHTLGALMMHFILETLSTALLVNVNPFGQPAVEEGKILAYHYLAHSLERP